MADATKITGNYIEGLWKFLASVKLTVVVLLLLAVLSIIGTLIPQNAGHAEYLEAYGAFRYSVFNTLDIFDMYRSWWFQGLIALLVINIIVCSIDRLRTAGKIIFTRHPKFNLANYRRRKSRKEFEIRGEMEAARAAYQGLMARVFSYCRVVESEHGVAVTAEKGRWTRLGVYAVHLSVVILLVGSLVGSLRGFEGYVNIPEGASADSIQLRFKQERLKLPFTIQCDDFDVQFYDNRRPKEYRSKLTIIENGQPVLQKDIIVNDPLRYKGINIFQSSYGKINEPAHTADMPKDFELGVKSVASGMTYNVRARMNEPVDLPEGLGKFELKRYQPETSLGGMDLGPAFFGTLTPGEGEPQTLMLPIKFPKFDGMRRGDVIISVLQSGKLFEERYYTGLQVTKDPGVGLVYTGFILMILGCMVTFFMSHQQVVVELQPRGNRLAITVSGKTNKNKVGFDHKMERLAGKLAALKINSKPNH